MMKQVLNVKTLRAIFLIVLVVDLFSLPVYSQKFDCVKTKISKSDSIDISVDKSGVGDDALLEVSPAFTDLDISADGKKLSTCILKNNSARIVSLNSLTGDSELLSRVESLNSGGSGALRGICAISPDGSQVFAIGSGGDTSAPDKIYPFTVSQFDISRMQDSDGLNSFTPPDFATSLAVTPNKKYLVYTQNNADNNSLASIQSVEIKSNMLARAFIGQDIASITKAGTFLEFAKGDSSLGSKFVYGVFSDLQQGTGGSGKNLVIFRINQENGINQILGEFGNSLSVFSSPTFVGFSGIKLFKRSGEYYLFVSYFENDTNAGFGSFNYITKIAIFNVDFESDKAFLSLASKPTITVFKNTPCKSGSFHGIAGPVWIGQNKLYLVDNLSGENYFASYNIDWAKVSGNTNVEALTLTSSPLATLNEKSQLNSDIVGTLDGKNIFIAVGDTSSNKNSKLLSYVVDDSFADCSNVAKSIGVCDLTVLTLDAESMSGGSMFTPPSMNTNEVPPIVVNPTPAFTPPPSVIPSNTSSPGISSFPGLGDTSPQSSSNISNPVANSGRPTSAFGSKPSSSPKSKPKPKPISSIEDTLGIIPQPFIEPVQADLTPTGDVITLSSEINQAVDIKSLNLDGVDQVFNIPSVPNLIFTSIERPVIENVDASPTPTPSASIVKVTSSSSGSNPLPVISPTPVITTQELPIDFCCSCKTGSLSCDKNTQAICNGTVKCIGPLNKVLSCCKQVKGIEQCNGEDVSLRCLNTVVENKENSEPVKLRSLNVMFQASPVNSVATETKAFLKEGSAGVLINLKKTIPIKPKDLKNIIQVYIDDKTKSSFIIHSTNTLYSSSSILSKITFPENVKSGTGLFVTLLNKGGGKKEVLAKSRISVLDTHEFKNIGEDEIKGLPVIYKVSGRIAGSSAKGGTIVRLTLEGNNFAGRSIASGNFIFNAVKSKALTVISFTDNKNIEIIRTRVLNKGRKILLTIRYTGNDDISNRSLTVSTPKGHTYFEKLGLKLFSGKSIRSVTLDEKKK